MTELNLNEIDVVEEALQTWPLAKNPDGFSRRVLKRIAAVQTPRLKFGFTWLDYALAFFAVSVTFLPILIWNLLPDLFIMELTYRVFVLLKLAPYQSLLLYFLLGIGGFLVAIIFAAILFSYPNTLDRIVALNPKVESH